MERIFQSIGKLEKAVLRLEEVANADKNEPMLPFEMIPSSEIDKLKKKFSSQIDELKNKNKSIENAALNASLNLDNAIAQLKQMLK